MLALSPPLFSTNISYWPSEDLIGHDDQKPANSDHSVFLPTPLPSDQRWRDDLECLATPSTTTAFGSDVNMAVKKLNHNASERDRRKKINHLYSSLRALLPALDHAKKLSIPSTVSCILKYIPELQNQVEGLVLKREDLLSRQQASLVQVNHQTESTYRTSLSSVSASPLNNKEVVVQISTSNFAKNPLSEILYNLEEDGLSLLNASSFQSFGGRVFHNLHLRVEGSYGVECGTLSWKLASFYDNKEELLL